MTTSRTRDTWECMTFIYRTWQPDEVWCSLESPEKFTVPLARSFFWDKAEGRIAPALDSLIDEGWEPAEVIGPEAIKVRRLQKIDFRVSVSDVFFWFVTLGVGLVIQLFLDAPHRYITYQPIEFRLRLRRASTQRQPIKTAA